MHYPIVHHQYRAVWPIEFKVKRIISRHVSKGNVNKHHKNSEIDSCETWYIKKTTQIGLWSHCHSYVGQYIYAFAILTVFVHSHAISTQHPQTFHPVSPLFFETFHPASTRFTRIKTGLFFLPKVCSSATRLFVHFQKYLRKSKQYSSIQQRILAWKNSSRRARRHVWCWVEFHPHHCQRVIILRKLNIG